MTLRGLMFFLLAFTTVIVFGLLSGCATDVYEPSARAYQFLAICGNAPCDGNGIR